MDPSSESVVLSLGTFAEMLSDPEGYNPERLKSLSSLVPIPLSSFIEAILYSDEDVMRERLSDLEDYAAEANSIQAWFNLGRLAHRLFFHQAAIGYYSNAADLAEIRRDDSLPEILLSLGSLHGEEEDWDRACQCYERALKAMDEAQRPVLLPQVLDRLGRARRQQGDYHRARICYSRILEALEPGDSEGRMQATASLAELCRIQGDMERAEELYQICLKERERSHDPAGAAGILASLASIYWQTGKGKRAKISLQSASHLLADLGEHGRAAQIQCQLADIYFQEGEFKKALEIYHKSISALRKANPSLASQVLSHMSLCCLEEGDLIPAEDHLQRAIALMEKHGDPLSLSRALILLARIHHRQGLGEEALHCSRQSLKIRERSKDWSGAAEALSLMARICCESRDWEGAIGHYQRAAEIFIGNGEDLSAAEALSNLGGVYHLKGDLDSALDLHCQAIEILSRLGDRQSWETIWALPAPG